VKSTKHKRAALALVLALTLAIFAAPAFAQAETVTDEVPPPIEYGAIQAVYALGIATPMGFFIAFLTCMAGYASKMSPEKFKVENLIYTALISIVIGFITTYAGLTGLNAATAIAWLANGYITWYIWKISRIAAKTLTKKGIFTQPQIGPPTA
jgi:hypothetical protein